MLYNCDKNHYEGCNMGNICKWIKAVYRFEQNYTQSSGCLGIVELCIISMYGIYTHMFFQFPKLSVIALYYFGGKSKIN